MKFEVKRNEYFVLFISRYFIILSLSFSIISELDFGERILTKFWPVGAAKSGHMAWHTKYLEKNLLSTVKIYSILEFKTSLYRYNYLYFYFYLTLSTYAI